MGRKRVLVTGSSRGIGRAIAERLRQDGCEIAVHYGSQRAEGEAVATKVQGKAYQCDLASLSDPATASAFVDQVEADGPLTALVNNAGIYLPLPFAESSDTAFEDTWAKTFAVNLNAPALMMRVCGHRFIERGGGKIVNVASRVGHRGESGAAFYAASKAGLINLSRSLAVEWAKRNVQVFAVAPGWVETAMAREGMETRLEAILRDIPAGRMASPADCAAAVAFLLRDEAAYLTGITIDINGASYLR